MSRSKRTKSSDEIEQLKQENQELKSLVKSLERQVKKLNKEFKPEYVQEDLIKEDLDSKRNKCSRCNRGIIKETKLGPRVLINCTICDYSKVTKNG